MAAIDGSSSPNENSNSLSKMKVMLIPKGMKDNKSSIVAGNKPNKTSDIV
ncbi:hypothetical protein GTQ48_17360 [Alteromonas genovensis]|uniref:Uncharacterized protein n=1 Tax=Alteromonas genovensis TaxID=471225 RepID=A0A6N9TLB8_9ALTE|nr:hypothetical protein [Alteromonas genovensis]